MLPYCEQLALFHANQGLARSILRASLRRYPRPLPACMDPEDLLTTALLGLWDACRWYDPARGLFCAYARRAIRRRLFRTLEDARMRETSLSLDALLYPGSDAPLLDSLASPEPEPWEQVARKAEQERVRTLLNRLPDRTANAVRLWAQGFSPSEIGQQLGISRQRAHQLPREAAAKLRCMLEKETLSNV
jgi:RNA polymerase sigma factor (sigma-70 family)